MHAYKFVRLFYRSRSASSHSGHHSYRTLHRGSAKPTPHRGNGHWSTFRGPPTLSLSGSLRSSSFRISTPYTVTATVSLSTRSYHPKRHPKPLPRQSSMIIRRTFESHIAPTFTPSEGLVTSSSSANRATPLELQAPGTVTLISSIPPQNVGGRVARRDGRAIQVGLYAATRLTVTCDSIHASTYRAWYVIFFLYISPWPFRKLAASPCTVQIIHFTSKS
jgi:hypothetical protein